MVVFCLNGKLLASLSIAVACVVSQAGLVRGDDVMVEMTPLRYCSDKRWWGCRKHAFPLGGFWDDAGMWGAHQDRAFMAVMGEAPANPKYIAIFIHGQQGLSGDIEDSVANVVAGSQSEWKWETDNVGSKTKSVDSRSAAARFYNDQSRFLSNDETLYLTIWDPQFNHVAFDKEKIIEGYAKFLDSKVNWANVDGIVMVGISRGGCLAMRLAEDLRARYWLAHVQFALDVIDPVCRAREDEFGTYVETIINPVNSDYESWKTDIPGQLGGIQENYCIRNLALGEDVSGIGLGIRGFTHETCTAVDCQLNDFNGAPFYEQKWDDLCHSCAGRQFDAESLAITVEPVLAHLERCKTRFGW